MESIGRTLLKRNAQTLESDEFKRIKMPVVSSGWHEVLWTRVCENGSERMVKMTLDFLAQDSTWFLEDTELTSDLIDPDVFVKEMAIGPAFTDNVAFKFKLPCTRTLNISDRQSLRRALDDVEEMMAVRPSSEISPIVVVKWEDEEMYDVSLGTNPIEEALGEPCEDVEDQQVSAHWPEVCDFFCSDTTFHGRGIQPSGFEVRIPPRIMLSVYRVLHAWVDGVSNEAVPILDHEGEVALAAIISRCQQALDHCHLEDHGSRYQLTGEGFGPDATEQRCGVRCPCRPNSLTRRIVQKSFRGPHVILARDARDLGQYRDVIRRTLGPDHHDRRWISVVEFDERGLVGMALNDREEVVAVDPSRIVAQFNVSSRSEKPVPPSLTLAQLLQHVRVVPLTTTIFRGDMSKGPGPIEIDELASTMVLLNLEKLNVIQFDKTFRKRVNVLSRVGGTSCTVDISRAVVGMSVMGLNGDHCGKLVPALRHLIRDICCGSDGGGRKTLVSRQLRCVFDDLH